MTREEAIKAFEEIRANAQNHLGKKYAAGCEGYYRDKIELAEAALAALRGPTREMVERMRGEWIGDNEERVETIDGSPVKSATCSNCGNWLVGSDEYSCAGHFCPDCGAPMTDEAVDIELRRWKEVVDGEQAD